LPAFHRSNRRALKAATTKAQAHKDRANNMHSLKITAALWFSLAFSVSAQSPVKIHVFHHENVLGTSLELKLKTTSAKATKAEAAVLHEIDRENRILSAWSSTSEFSRWTRTHDTPVHISRELFEVLSLFDRWRDQTDGTLDASAETATRSWKLAAVENRLPTEAELQKAVEVIQQRHWKLDPVHRTATHLDDAPIALNSFAKSYIAGHAADAALAAGAIGVLLNIGGDIVLRGAITERVAITDPRATAENDEPMDLIRLSNRTIATSGNYRRGFDIHGTHYSHIIDPRTARPAESVLSSTVIAADPSTAGALATAFSVMTPAQSSRLAAALPNVDYLLVLKDGRTIASRNWSSRELPRFVTAAYAPAKQAAPSMDLLINLELARLDDPRYRRPYVAVWVEDSDHFPVRTLALWFQKPRWLPELKSWYRADQVRNLAEGTDLSITVSSATRSPGKYTLRWDGKDNVGKSVKPGKYTVMIEAAREHGTYGLIKQEINWDGKTPAQFAPAGNKEIASASFDYGKHN
jgi:thiamine biosynthesis lipoprotein ApbE